jgi:pilus assembly protein CpaB
MWKVKRMNTARIVVLAIALGAGSVALYLASGANEPAPAPQVAQLPTTDVLVAKADIAMGQTLGADDVQWQSWPASAAGAAVIRRNDRPEASTQIAGSIARSPFIAGEPIREPKLVRANGAGFMAAVLPAGMRAVSTEISPETGAGGFILPNDRVDVILSKRERGADRGGIEVVNSEIILSNIRVLAIDQAPREKDGQNTVVGKTATLELKPDQAELLARARQSGTLSLALRALVDVNVVEPKVDEANNGKRDAINIIRYGVPTPATIQK